MTSFLLIRHAESPWSPDSGRSLSPAGQVASIELAHRLAPMEPAALYSSPYFRARQTIEPLATLLLNAFDPSVGYDFWISLRHPDAFTLELRAPDRAVFARL